MASILLPPRLRLLESGQRRATWLELFYDLAFVVAVAELAGTLADHQVGVFAGLFVPVWWAWAGYVFYANRFDTDDLSSRLIGLAQIPAIALMAASLSDPAGRSTLFALAYVAARVLLIAAYLRVARHIPQARPLALRYVAGFSVAAALWLVSPLVPEPVRYPLWAVAVLIDLATPFLARRYQAAIPPQHEHLPERFGLFVVIVLGEVVAAIVLGLKQQPEDFPIGLAGIAVAAAFWWAYFSRLNEEVVGRTRLAGQVWVYAHLPLSLALVAFGVGVEQLIVHPGAWATGLTGVSAAGAAALLWTVRKL
ncbi:low temperature requirement protein A [Nonomuraea soli]|uniref:Low temperature requirement protein LtrA n=1 Tax=Nonomuraea soli TaxID=1032476 RepID=A0A7W0CM08_9ACTN|nr:low temperature requirement protein A [Nonomuraea soli]MBA2893668.1 low temperature requirement protein LtrA [Nonomuraea soli]